MYRNRSLFSEFSKMEPDLHQAPSRAGAADLGNVGDDALAVRFAKFAH